MHTKMIIKTITCIFAMFFLAGCGGGVNTPVTSDFPSLTKTLGDAPFALATPESSDPTPFTYTSDDRGVATIAGNIVTLVGPGTVKITASQIKNNFPILIKTSFLTVLPGSGSVGSLPPPSLTTLALNTDSVGQKSARSGVPTSMALQRHRRASWQLRAALWVSPAELEVLGDSPKEAHVLA